MKSSNTFSRAAHRARTGNTLTTESTGVAASARTIVITSPNKRSAAAALFRPSPPRVAAAGYRCATISTSSSICYPAKGINLRSPCWGRAVATDDAPPSPASALARAARVSTAAAPPSQGALVIPAAARALAGIHTTPAPPLMPANLEQHFAGKVFAQQRVGVAMPGAGGTGRRQGKQGRGNTVARSADNSLIQKCVKEHVFPKQKFVTDVNLDFSNNDKSIFDTWRQR